MKQETKELIKWIEFTLKDYENNVKGNSHLGDKDRQCELNYIKRSIELLDSLPEIESHLCRGGYIQDRNGTPCCDGELVYFLSKSQKETYGYLIWDKKMARFVIEIVDERDCKYIVPELEWFEKVQFEKVSELEKVEE